ncbi:MAG: phospholipase D-like domain-containing protein [Verrucomicrobiales bacterium]
MTQPLAVADSASADPVPFELTRHQFQWLGTGRSLLLAQLEAIIAARASVRLEMYIFHQSKIGDRYREELINAADRGAEVWVLIDALGSFELPGDYFNELIARPNGHMRWFNRPRFDTLSFRDHRKVVVADAAVAFLGGGNIAEEYCGDGVTEGWRDGGLGVRGPVVEVLAEEFDAQFARAEQKRWRVHHGHHRRRVPCGAEVDALFLKPGFGRNPLSDAMRQDLRVSREISLISAYFLPTLNLRRQLTAAAQRGARVRLILAGKSDVPFMQLAGRSYYRALLRRGIEIYEFEPQILHAKMFLLDDIVYIGSANLDPRSLRINFELMLRIHDAPLAEVARNQFALDLSHSRRVTLADLRGRTSWWLRLKQNLARWVLARLDPLIAETRMRRWIKSSSERRARRAERKPQRT